MRVIAGKYRGHSLFCPAGRDVRPTLDRVKEAVFSKIAYLLPDTMVLDLFSGCGNLGIEALSREAEKVCFCESDKRHIDAIKKNLSALKIAAKNYEFAGEVFFAISKFKQNMQKFDIIFADPPYKQLYKGLKNKETKKLTVEYLVQDSAVWELMTEDTVLIVEHQKDVTLPSETDNLVRFDLKTYGNIVVSFYKLKI